MTRYFAVVPLLLMYSLITPAAADDREDCFQSTNSELRISGCTNLIASGTLEGKDLAFSYHNRGIAYEQQGDLVKAIIDFKTAARLIPESDPWKARVLARLAKIRTKLAVRSRMKYVPTESIVPSPNSVPFDFPLGPSFHYQLNKFAGPQEPASGFRSLEADE